MRAFRSSGPLVAVFITLATISTSAAVGADGTEAKPGPAWRPWSPALFEEARATGRFVLLELEAVWCHWCHVMEATTYVDRAVLALLERHFIAVKVDQDAHPDLSKRYENWGWPAIIVFDRDGREL